MNRRPQARLLLAAVPSNPPDATPARAAPVGDPPTAIRAFAEELAPEFGAPGAKAAAFLIAGVPARARAELLDKDGKFLQAVTTKAGAADFHDMPAVALPPATAHVLRVVHDHDRLVDREQPVKVRRNGKTVFEGKAARQADAILESLDNAPIPRPPRPRCWKWRRSPRLNIAENRNQYSRFILRMRLRRSPLRPSNAGGSDDNPRRNPDEHALENAVGVDARGRFVRATDGS